MGRRVKVGIGLVAAVVVAATGSVVWIAHTRDSHATATSKRVALGRLPRFDDAVVLPANATAGDAAKVQAVLDESAAVKAYAPISARTVEFMLRMQQPDGTASVTARMCADPTTRTFAVALTRTIRDAHRQTVRAIKKRADVLDVGEDVPDVEIFVDSKASAAASASLRRQIDHDPDVVKIAAGDVAPSFQLQVRDGVPLAAVQGRYQHVAAVSYVTPRSNSFWSHAEPTSPTSEVEVFMQVKATNAQIDVVDQQLKRDPHVKSYRFFDHNDAYREFKKLFADQPSIIENETPAGLPTSFRVTLRSVNDVASFDRDVHARPGVKQVNSGVQSCTSKP